MKTLLLLAASSCLLLFASGCVSDAEYHRQMQALATAKEKCEVTGSRLRRDECAGEVAVVGPEALERASERAQMLNSNALTNATR